MILVYRRERDQRRGLLYRFLVAKISHEVQEVPGEIVASVDGLPPEDETDYIVLVKKLIENVEAKDLFRLHSCLHAAAEADEYEERFGKARIKSHVDFEPNNWKEDQIELEIKAWKDRKSQQCPLGPVCSLKPTPHAWSCMTLDGPQCENCEATQPGLYE